MLWSTDQLASIRRAVEVARTGGPAVVQVVGSVGSGKSSLLRELTVLADDFQVLHAEGIEPGDAEPLTLLARLGFDVVHGADGPNPEPRLAAQALREQLDERTERGPVAIVVDDLHWADPESVEALYWLVSRADQDRLLVATGTSGRGLAARHPLWSRWVDRGGEAVQRVDLRGLSPEQVGALMQQVGSRPVRASQARRVWEHTGGNPFALTTLLRRYSPEELAVMPVLPAPDEIADRVSARLTQTSPDAVALLRASAVVGWTWTSVQALGAIAEVEDPWAAAQVLLDGGLLVEQSPAPGASVRPVHTLVCAAVYGRTPWELRRVLHARAAQVLEGRMTVLEHRVGAAHGYDDALSAELDALADASHESREFRHAARLRRWSAQVAYDTAARERDTLDALFESILARDLVEVADELERMDWASDVPRGLLVRAFLADRQSDPRRCLGMLEDLTPEQLAAADPLTRHRVLVLRARSMLMLGSPTEDIDAVVAEIAPEPVDTALANLHAFTLAQLRIRHGDLAATRALVDSVPRRPAATPMAQTSRLAVRGMLFAFWGLAQPAESDLVEVTARISSGRFESGEGAHHAALGLARWLLGSWELARVDLGVALDMVSGHKHPMVVALDPLLPLIRGDAAAAQVAALAAEDELVQTPWRETMSPLLVTEVAALQATGDVAQQRALLGRLSARFGDDLVRTAGWTPPLLALNVARAAVWAGDLDVAGQCAERIEDAPLATAWATWTRAWLDGLVAEARGDLDGAARLLGAAVTDPSRELPVLRAHAVADLARVEVHRGNRAAAERHAEAADAEYRRLGASVYARERAAHPDLPVAGDPLGALSDRERDVAVLLVQGLSYAQIARDLFVTRSTVGFHLTRIYAKTGVTSRHGLTDLVRAGAVA